MRHLVLMRGAQGAGKDTWIERNSLTGYSLSTDVIRLQMQSPQLNTNGTFSISQKNDDSVWDYLFHCLEARMERGEFTIINATHSRIDMISRYRKLAEKYRYRVYVLTLNVPLDELLARNSNRPTLAQVPEDVIKNAFARIQTQEPQKWVIKLTPETFWNTFAMEPIDSNAFSRIIHIGDIHGCFEPLAQVLSEVTDGDLVIFVGDYFDRGIQNAKVFNALYPLMQNKNYVFLQGNHEKGLYQWAFDEDYVKRGFRTTATQFEEAGISKENARQFYRKLSQASFYTWREQQVLVCHGGIPTRPNPFISSDCYINGVGKYEHLPEVYDGWLNNSWGITQVHGHRNEQGYPILNDRIVNLCGTPELGGSLRVATLSESGWEAREYPSTVFNTRLIQIPAIEVITSSDVVAKLRANKNVRESHQFGDVSSFNYTSRAFWDKAWDSDTIKSRGLYLGTSDGRVVARGYKKFFAVGEHSSSSKGELKNNLKFPVTASIKYNGYLGIVGYDSVTDTVIVGTKGGVHNDYALRFREMLPLEVVSEYVKQNNVSLTFEVIDPINDPHIIEYQEAHLVLLDIISNQLEFSKKEYSEVQSLASFLGIECRNIVRVFEDWQSVHDFIDEQDEYRDLDVEGYVLEDANLYMFRIKSRYYRFWKHMRTILDSVKAGRQISLSQLFSDKHNYVYAEMLKRKGTLTDIIAFRNSI